MLSVLFVLFSLGFVQTTRLDLYHGLIPCILNKLQFYQIKVYNVKLFSLRGEFHSLCQSKYVSERGQNTTRIIDLMRALILLLSTRVSYY